MEQFNPFSLKGKTVLVIGASSGMGREIAIECSKMGAHVIICARHEEALQECLDVMDGEGHSYIRTDITNEVELETLISEVPPVDGVVISAGIGGITPIQFSTREKFDKIFNLNFFASVETARLLYKKKKLKSNGSLVLISSIAGDYRITPGKTIYGTAKSALNSFMRYAAIEFSSRKIRVNTINPGMVFTKLINSSGALTDEDYKKDMDTYPLKRYGEVSDIAPAAIYLLSDASSWLTGQSLVIDGGISLK